ncbi:MAG: tetratricopeptide repeat protein [Rickettsiaceae bacterium]
MKEKYNAKDDKDYAYLETECCLEEDQVTFVKETKIQQCQIYDPSIMYTCAYHLYELGIINQSQNPKKAISYFNKALIIQKMLNKDEPYYDDILIIYQSIAHTYEQQGDNSSAIKYYNLALDGLLGQENSNNSGYIAYICHRLSSAHKKRCEENDMQIAKYYLEQEQKLESVVPDKTSSWAFNELGSTFFKIAECADNKNEYLAKAHTYLECARGYAVTDVDILATHCNLAALYTRIQAVDEAIESFDIALQMFFKNANCNSNQVTQINEHIHSKQYDKIIQALNNVIYIHDSNDTHLTINLYDSINVIKICTSLAELSIITNPTDLNLAFGCIHAAEDLYNALPRRQQYFMQSLNDQIAKVDLMISSVFAQNIDLERIHEKNINAVTDYYRLDYSLARSSIEENVVAEEDDDLAQSNMTMMGFVDLWHY